MHTNTYLTKQTFLIVIVGVVFGALVVYLLSQQVAKERLSTLETHTLDAIADQQALLVAIAETTARNGADAITEGIVRDCQLSDRTQFDDLLGRLNDGLPPTQLNTLERLFDRCGSFFAERKAVMVSRLMREIAVYKFYVNQLSLIKSEEVNADYSISEWQRLAEEEQKMSQMYAELVRLQGEIITTLQNPSPDADLDTILREVREVQDTLIVINTQAGMIRSGLVGL